MALHLWQISGRIYDLFYSRSLIGISTPVLLDNMNSFMKTSFQLLGRISKDPLSENINFTVLWFITNLKFGVFRGKGQRDMVAWVLNRHFFLKKLSNNTLSVTDDNNIEFMFMIYLVQ